MAEADASSVRVFTRKDNPPGALDGERAGNIRAQIRLNLSTGQLPRPFQINAITSQSWQLDSGWQSLSINSGN